MLLVCFFPHTWLFWKTVSKNLPGPRTASIRAHRCVQRQPRASVGGCGFYLDMNHVKNRGPELQPLHSPFIPTAHEENQLILHVRLSSESLIFPFFREQKANWKSRCSRQTIWGNRSIMLAEGRGLGVNRGELLDGKGNNLCKCQAHHYSWVISG